MKFIVVFRPRFAVIFKNELLLIEVSDDMFKVGDNISPYLPAPFLSPCCYSLSSSRMFKAPVDVVETVWSASSGVGSSSRLCMDRFMSMSGLLRIMVMLRTSSLCFSTDSFICFSYEREYDVNFEQFVLLLSQLTDGLLLHADELQQLLLLVLEGQSLLCWRDHLHGATRTYLYLVTSPLR